MAEKTTADIGFEKQIWDAACVLCGNMSSLHIRMRCKVNRTKM